MAGSGIKTQYSVNMSLRSGKNYLKEDTTTLLEEASGEQQTEVVDQATKKKVTHPARDAKSKSSKTSTRYSSSSSSATKVYAKAKAAKAELAFAEREAETMRRKAELEANMLKQKASFDADLHLLQCQRAAAAAEAEATAFQEAEVESWRRSQLPDVEEEPLSTIQRTSEYVKRHSDMFIQEQPLEPVVVETHERKMYKQETLDTKHRVSHDIQRNTQPVYRHMKKEPTRNVVFV